MSGVFPVPALTALTQRWICARDGPRRLAAGDLDVEHHRQIAIAELPDARR